MVALLAQVAGFCANNNGAFVSEKQANYFMAKYNGRIEEGNSYSFGEFNGCTRHTVTVVLFDTNGIYNVSVHGAKVKVMFDKASGINQYADNKAKKAADKIAADIIRAEEEAYRAANKAANIAAITAKYAEETESLRSIFISAGLPLNEAFNSLVNNNIVLRDLEIAKLG